MGTPLVGGKIDNALSIGDFLQDAHVRAPLCVEYDVASLSTAALVHIVSPRLTTLDRGKSRLAPLPAVRLAVGEALWRTSKTLYEEGERRRNDIRKANRARVASAEQRTQRARAGQLSVEAAVFRVLPEAYDFATGGGAMPVSAHALFYQVRPRVWELVKAGIAKPLRKNKLDSSYVEQKVIPAYERNYGALPGLYREPRGVLHEPHSDVALPLGTRDVEGYEFPEWRFDKVLFVEKTALVPGVRASGLGERFDMAVIASQGFSAVACRTLLARAVTHDIRVFVLHDADWSGYEIARTLAEPTARMPDHQIEVIDVGLKLEDGIARGLPIEPQVVKGTLSAQLAPRLTERELAAFTGKRIGGGYRECERIELDAFSTPELIAFIEEKLAEHGADTKLVPPLDALRANARDTAHPELAEIVRDEIVRRLDVDGIVDRVLASAVVTGVENDAVTSVSEETIADLLTKDGTSPWEWVLREHVVELIDAERDEIDAAIDAALPKAERSS
jgi:hypothetical protein